GDLLHDPEVGLEQVVARHARLAREARGHDHEVRARDRLVAVRARHLGVRSEQGCALGDVERLALRHALDHVEEHHVAELAIGDLLGEHAADVAGSDEPDLRPSHGGLLAEVETADRDGAQPMWAMIASPNSLHLSSLAPSMSRWKS